MDSWKIVCFFSLYVHTFESLFGGFSREIQVCLLDALDQEEQALLSRVKGVVSNEAGSLGRGTHGTVKEEGDTHLASQIN